jgi:hypothetical protein
LSIDLDVFFGADLERVTSGDEGGSEPVCMGTLGAEASDLEADAMGVVLDCVAFTNARSKKPIATGTSRPAVETIKSGGMVGGGVTGVFGEAPWSLPSSCGVRPGLAADNEYVEGETSFARALLLVAAFVIPDLLADECPAGVLSALGAYGRRYASVVGDKCVPGEDASRSASSSSITLSDKTWREADE